jgi:hypothetical protein
VPKVELMITWERGKAAGDSARTGPGMGGCIAWLIPTSNIQYRQHYIYSGRDSNVIHGME